MSRPPVTGAQRRRYESRTRPTTPLKATLSALERAIAESGATGMHIQWDGPGIVVVMAEAPGGEHIGGRATLAEYASDAIAIMHAGAACIRGLIDARKVKA